MTESQTIASVQIHVEGAIQQIENFRQIPNEIPIVLHGSINQIWTVSCLLCSFMHLYQTTIIIQNKCKLFIIGKKFSNYYQKTCPIYKNKISYIYSIL